MHLTWLDSNSWLIEMAQQRILLDPWLVGPLVFGNTPWFFKGEKNRPPSIPEAVDGILLSQGLPDHAHPETLKQLDHQIPVIGSANAAKVVQDLGYIQVTALAHGERTQLANLEILALPGAPIGPFLVENGYLLKDLEQGTTLYYEPHGYHAAALQDLGSVDVVITPLTSLSLPLVGAFIRGGEVALQPVEWLKPQVILSTTTGAGSDVEFSGFLNPFITEADGPEVFQGLLADRNLSTQVLTPKPGQRVAVPLAG
ncbi:MBL fold metallo-hydrolase [Synechococcales cyanobacterium C]|uniref:MBL fold metallo-hydrolase n=1 Tax=Petrachloros mirabilis ULC683 TaxID=2781853 RepID=A0A8K2A6Y5_9CYAN|nr:MBL fold metallo-hydrolase [Petrachloros mirabilis]NCJ05575.1 MBL fold metallo-hydrolase [Petrachloros mirabilis ULC683]